MLDMLNGQYTTRSRAHTGSEHLYYTFALVLMMVGGTLSLSSFSLSSQSLSWVAHFFGSAKLTLCPPPLSLSSSSSSSAKRMLDDRNRLRSGLRLKPGALLP